MVLSSYHNSCHSKHFMSITLPAWFCIQYPLPWEQREHQLPHQGFCPVHRARPASSASAVHVGNMVLFNVLPHGSVTSVHRKPLTASIISMSCPWLCPSNGCHVRASSSLSGQHATCSVNCTPAMSIMHHEHQLPHQVLSCRPTAMASIMSISCTRLVSSCHLRAV